MIIRVRLTRPENLDYFGALPDTVASLDLEDYVAAVVASEVGNAHVEACKAQAVAARTYAMPYTAEGKCVSDKSGSNQAFRAARWDVKAYPNAAEAANATAGEVLTYGGKILKTCSFSASNGGRTTSSEARWGGVRPYLIAQDDPWDAAACADKAARGAKVLKGHGVGMSQLGAAWAAGKGVGYRAILDFYYPGTEIAENYGGEKDMTVYIGSARGDERGKASGGKAGDQTGKEVSTQAWYKHSKGWRVFRAIDADKAAKIAACMKAACANDKIGYDQGQRNTLYNAAKPYGFDVSRVKIAVETDCSALVRVCCNYAGIAVPNCNTESLPRAVLATGAFVELTGSKYTDRPDYLRAGDILCTATKGHTAVVLNDGDKAEKAPAAPVPAARPALKRGSKGDAVTLAQGLLWAQGFDLRKYGIDGDYGTETYERIRDFQLARDLDVTGVVDAATWVKLWDVSTMSRKVTVTGASVNVRLLASTASAKRGVARRGDVLPYLDEYDREGGWYRVAYKDGIGWISAKYSDVEAVFHMPM